MSTFGSPLNSGDVAQNAVGFTTLVQYNTITFANTTAKFLFNIPKPYLALDIYIDVLTVFNSSGTDLVSIGSVATPTLFASGIDVSTLGRKIVSASATNAQFLAWLDTTDDGTVLLLNGLYAQTVADATTGLARITLEYTVPKILNP